MKIMYLPCEGLVICARSAQAELEFIDPTSPDEIAGGELESEFTFGTVQLA